MERPLTDLTKAWRVRGYTTRPRADATSGTAPRGGLRDMPAGPVPTLLSATAG